VSPPCMTDRAMVSPAARPKLSRVVFLVAAAMSTSDANYLGEIPCDAGVATTHTGTTTGGSSNHNEGSRAGNDAVWTLTLGQPMTVTLNQCASTAVNFPNLVVPGSSNTWDSVLRLYDTCLSDGCLNAGTCNTYPMGTNPGSNNTSDNQDNCGVSALQEYRRVTLPQGQYVIVLDSMLAITTGDFVLNVSCSTPLNTAAETPLTYHSCANCYGVTIPAGASRGDCPALGDLSNGVSW
jgi:hypothetical protein